MWFFGGRLISTRMGTEIVRILGNRSFFRRISFRRRILNEVVFLEGLLCKQCIGNNRTRGCGLLSEGRGEFICKEKI